MLASPINQPSESTVSPRTRSESPQSADGRTNDVHESRPTDALLVLTHLDADTEPVLLTGGRWSVGSADGNRLQLAGDHVGARHCLIVVTSLRTIIKSWDPRTWRNGRPIQDAELRPGDELRIGGSRFSVRSAASGELISQLPCVSASPVTGEEDRGGSNTQTERSADRALDVLSRVDQLAEALDGLGDELHGREESPGRLDQLVDRLQHPAQTPHVAAEPTPGASEDVSETTTATDQELDSVLCEVDQVVGSDRADSTREQRSAYDEQAAHDEQVARDEEAARQKQSAEIDSKWRQLETFCDSLEVRSAVLDAQSYEINERLAELQRERQEHSVAWSEVEQHRQELEQHRQEVEQQREQVEQLRHGADEQRQEVEQQRHDAEQQRLDAEQRLQEVEQQRLQVEQQRHNTEQQRQEVEQQRHDAEQQRLDAEQRLQEVEQQRQEVEQQQHDAEQQRLDAEQRLQEVEQQRQELARQMDEMGHGQQEIEFQRQAAQSAADDLRALYASLMEKFPEHAAGFATEITELTSTAHALAAESQASDDDAIAEPESPAASEKSEDADPGEDREESAAAGTEAVHSAATQNSTVWAPVEAAQRDKLNDAEVSRLISERIRFGQLVEELRPGASESTDAELCDEREEREERDDEEVAVGVGSTSLAGRHETTNALRSRDEAVRQLDELVRAATEPTSLHPADSTSSRSNEAHRPALSSDTSEPILPDVSSPDDAHFDEFQESSEAAPSETVTQNELVTNEATGSTFDDDFNVGDPISLLDQLKQGIATELNVPGTETESSAWDAISSDAPSNDADDASASTSDTVDENVEDAFPETGSLLSSIFRDKADESAVAEHTAETASDSAAARDEDDPWMPATETVLEAATDSLNGPGSLLASMFNDDSNDPEFAATGSDVGVSDFSHASHPEAPAGIDTDVSDETGEGGEGLRSQLADMFDLPELRKTSEQTPASEASLEQRFSTFYNTDDDAAADTETDDVTEPVSAPEDSDEDSISSYMEQLLARNRRETSSERDEVVEPESVPEIAPDRVESAEPDNDRTWLSEGPLHKQDRRQVQAETKAFRALANQSARSAVDVSTGKQLRTAVIVKTLASVMALITGAAAFYLELPKIFGFGVLGIGLVFSIDLGITIVRNWTGMARLARAARKRQEAATADDSTSSDSDDTSAETLNRRQDDVSHVSKMDLTADRLTRALRAEIKQMAPDAPSDTSTEPTSTEAASPATESPEAASSDATASLTPSLEFESRLSDMFGDTNKPTSEDE